MFNRTLTASAILATLTMLPAAAQVVIVDTDFTAAEGYTDGELRNFATITPNAGNPGVWLGQTGPMVDTSGTGSVSMQGAFLRNHWNMGALGGQSGGDGSTEGGGAAHPTPAGFGIGDTVMIETVYRFELDNAVANRALLQQGIRPNFVLAGFESAPAIGAQIAYNPFEDGELKFFTDLSRTGFDGANNPFALFVEPLAVGVDNGWDGAAYTNPTDLVSDNIRITWEAEYQGADTWQATELIVENADTATLLATASVDAPDALEAITFAGSGSEAFGAMRLIRDQPFGTGPIGTIDSYSFVYTEATVSGLAADFNEDGTVDLLDLDILGSNWQAMGVTKAQGDANGDGNVDLLDLDVLGGQWQQSGSFASALAAAGIVPEPASIALIGAGSLMIARRRRTA